ERLAWGLYRSSNHLRFGPRRRTAKLEAWRHYTTRPYGNEPGGFTVVDALSNETVHWQIGGGHPDSEPSGGASRGTPIKEADPLCRRSRYLSGSEVSHRPTR